MTKGDDSAAGNSRLRQVKPNETPQDEQADIEEQLRQVLDDLARMNNEAHSLVQDSSARTTDVRA